MNLGKYKDNLKIGSYDNIQDFKHDLCLYLSGKIKADFSIIDTNLVDKIYSRSEYYIDFFVNNFRHQDFYCRVTFKDHYTFDHIFRQINYEIKMLCKSGKLK